MPDTRGLAGLISDDTSLLVLRLLMFSIFPLIMATRLVRLKRVGLTRKSLRPPFYSQCYVAAPVRAAAQPRRNADRMADRAGPHSGRRGDRHPCAALVRHPAGALVRATSSHIVPSGIRDSERGDDREVSCSSSAFPGCSDQSGNSRIEPSGMKSSAWALPPTAVVQDWLEISRPPRRTMTPSESCGWLRRPRRSWSARCGCRRHSHGRHW